MTFSQWRQTNLINSSRNSIVRFRYSGKGGNGFKIDWLNCHANNVNKCGSRFGRNGYKCVTSNLCRYGPIWKQATLPTGRIFRRKACLLTNAASSTSGCTNGMRAGRADKRYRAGRSNQFGQSIGSSCAKIHFVR